MTQISRPFQIVLVVFALFVCVWFVALRAHNSSTTGGSGASASGSSASASSPAPASSGAAKAKAATPARTARVSHGASAVTVKRSTSAAVGHTKVVHTTVVKHPSAAKPAHTTVVHTTVVTHTSTAKPAPKTTAAAGAQSMQIAVEHELQQGKTVLILFWNPRGADDLAVHNELPAVQHALGAKIAVNYASASQVGAFGTITRAVQVTQTPTLLVVNPHGQTTVLTGLADAFSIEQLVREAA